MKIHLPNNIHNSCIWLLLLIMLTLLLPVYVKADSQLDKHFSVSSWIADLSADISNINLENDSYQKYNDPNQFNLLKTDYILYYELLDQWFSFDLGFSVMNFDGNISSPSVSPLNHQTLDIYVPTGYGKIQFKSSNTGMLAGVEASLFSFGENSVSDYKIYLGWKTYSKIQFEMGYKRFALSYNDLNSNNGIQIFNGYYTSVFLPF
ncbi:MAG: hypothetical protein GY781_01930 [Gammaproteobacteria bacterium]|nr:hypothetical protein [Gammaproteobacteria bacterium]